MGWEVIGEIVIGGYRVEAQLGRGGMATVYRAIQESLDRPVALKVMAPALAAEADFTERFLKEGRTAAQLTHPHILAVHDIGVSGHHHYIAMEYVGGGDLKARIRAGLEPDAALQVVRQIAAALGFAHERGFVHRDVKPENILFRDDRTAVLADFGIARVVGSGTRMTGTGMSIGTPHYMSPEQARGQEVDARSDLYSLGIVLYEALTGQVPYDAEDSVAVGIQHVTGALPQLPAHLQRYQPLLDRLLAKQPAERPADAGALITLLDQALAGQALPDAPPTTVVPPTQERSSAAQPSAGGRRSGLKWGVGGGVAALLLLGGVYVWQQRPGLLERPFSPGAGGSQVASSADPAAVDNPTTAASASDASEAADDAAPSATTAAADDTQGGSADTSGAASLVGNGEAILEVKSEPSGATVWLDGQKLGRTPYFEDTIVAGRRELTVKRPNYTPYTAELHLKPQIVRKREVALEKGSGTLTVLTEPPGAQVVLDGEARDGETPLTIADLEAGEHNLMIRKPRYRTHEQSLEVPMGETKKVSLALEGGDLVEHDGEWISREEKVNRLLTTAEEHLAADRLTRPEGINAHAVYRAVLKLDDDNKRATEGIKRIAKRYIELVRAATGNREFEKAERYLDQASALDRDGIELGASLRAALRVERHLAEGGRHLQADRLTMPEDNNARASYRAVLDIQGDNARARRGLRAIPERYLELARGAIENRRLDRAQIYLEKAETLGGEALEGVTNARALLAKLRRPPYSAGGASFAFQDVPGGEFRMGKLAGEGDNHELPIHVVDVEPFRMMTHEVTFAQWDACVRAGGCSHRPDDEGWGRGERPVVNVSWEDVTQDFIPWLNQATGQEFRLPSEAEWEYAARAGTTTQYHWGDRIGDGNANCDGCGSRWDDERTAPVGSFSPNAFGLYDMHGNVYEWAQDCWNDSYAGAPTDGSVWRSGGCDRRVMRGGSWGDGPRHVRSANRNWYAAAGRDYLVGFRLVQDP